MLTERASRIARISRIFDLDNGRILLPLPQVLGSLESLESLERLGLGSDENTSFPEPHFPIQIPAVREPLLLGILPGC